MLSSLMDSKNNFVEFVVNKPTDKCATNVLGENIIVPTFLTYIVRELKCIKWYYGSV